ncbi:MAG: hypothetical protein ACI4J6_04305 [Oscillospiraceae bacterium]
MNNQADSVSKTKKRRVPVIFLSELIVIGLIALRLSIMMNGSNYVTDGKYTYYYIPENYQVGQYAFNNIKSDDKSGVIVTYHKYSNGGTIYIGDEYEAEKAGMLIYKVEKSLIGRCLNAEYNEDSRLVFIRYYNGAENVVIYEAK